MNNLNDNFTVKNPFTKTLLVILCFSSTIFSIQIFAQPSQLVEISESSKKASIYFVVKDPAIYQEKWHTLAQSEFWLKVMNASPEVSFINIASTRTILKTIPTSLYQDRNHDEKECFRDSLKNYFGLSEDTELYITSGKRDFYKFEHALPSVSKAVKIFSDRNIDPWFAQAILLIESPNKLQKSNVGAYGSFQLMSHIARKYGLTVNRYRDDRKDFTKSCYAAIGLLSKECIPRAKQMLRSRNIKFKESDLWFKLLVLHIYHAGYKNVGGVLRVINAKKGGMQLIKKIWHTQYRTFRNASQNYSQVALASLISLDKIIDQKFHLISKNNKTNLALVSTKIKP